MQANNGRTIKLRTFYFFACVEISFVFPTWKKKEYLAYDTWAERPATASEGAFFLVAFVPAAAAARLLGEEMESSLSLALSQSVLLWIVLRWVHFLKSFLIQSWCWRSLFSASRPAQLGHNGIGYTYTAIYTTTTAKFFSKASCWPGWSVRNCFLVDRPTDRRHFFPFSPLWMKESFSFSATKLFSPRLSLPAKDKKDGGEKEKVALFLFSSPRALTPSRTL